MLERLLMQRMRSHTERARVIKNLVHGLGGVRYLFLKGTAVCELRGCAFLFI